MMNKCIIILILVLISSKIVAQNNPSGGPTQFSVGWFRHGWDQSDSGKIFTNRNPNFIPRFPGTVEFYQDVADSLLHLWTGGRWLKLIPGFDSTSLSNRINIKLNITDTTNRWWGIGKRWVDTVYRVNDSTIGFTINGGVQQTLQILGRVSGGGGGGSGTVTSVALSMPSAFSVSGSPIASSGTLSVSGSGTTSQYIRGNGTLATTDTSMIPNFYTKIRGLFSATSPLTYNSFTGVSGIQNANTTGTKGAATFSNSSFSDNGSGLISLNQPVTPGSCTNCNVTWGIDGRPTAYSNGSGGTTLNNIGLGYRWVATPTGNIKTFFTDITGTIDSSSNTNGITYKVDTNYIATRSICQWPNERSLDTFYKKSNWINTNDFTLHGTATLNSTGNYLDVSGGDGTYGTNYITFSNVTMLSKWKMTILIKLTGTLISGGGLAAGLKFVNSNAQYDIQGSFALNNTGSTPIYIASTRGGGTVYQTSAGSLSFSQNDVIKLEFELNDSAFTVTGTNITTSSSAVTTTYTWATPSVAAGQIPNSCSFAILPIKGTQQIQYLSLSSNEKQFASLAMLGDSKDQLGFANHFSSRIGNQISPIIPTTITRAGEGDGVTQMIAGTAEIKLLSPRIVLLNIGSNSIRQGMNTYQTFSTYDSIVTSIASTGIQVYHMVMPEDTVDNPTSAVGMSLFKQLVQTTYGSYYLNKVWDTLADTNNRLKSAFDSGDGIHLNQAGVDATVMAILNSNKLTGCPSRVRDDYFIAGTLTNAATFKLGGNDNYILKKLGSTTSNSLLYDNGTGVGFGTTTPVNKLEVTGNDFTNSIVKFGTTEIQSTQDANAFISNNGFFNGSNWQYRVNGAVAINQLFNDSIILYLLPTGTAGGIVDQQLYRKIEIGPREFKSKIPVKTLDTLTFLNLKAPPSTYNILVHGLTDSIVYQVPTSALGTTIYNGDGTLSSDRNVSSGGNTLRFAGVNNSDTLVSIINSGTTSTGLYASGTALGINIVSAGSGLQSFGGTKGAVITGDTDEGLLVKSNTVRGARIQTVPSSTNTVVEVLQLERGSSSGAGATGIGEYVSFLNKASDNGSYESNTIISKLTDGTAATRTSQLSFTGVNNASQVTLATFDGNGNVTFGTTNSIVGTTTNNNAVAGNIGEEVNSTISTYTNYTTTATYQNITSITLSAGDWDITAQGTFSANGATITGGSDAIFVISTTTASASGATEGKNISYVPQAALLGTSHESITIAPYRVSLSGSTTYYLNSQATFTVGNPQYTGTIRARRIR